MAETQMEVETNQDKNNYPGRWRYLQNILSRSGPFVHPDFEASSDILPFITETCQILVIGAGGLGCEILKNLALSGFHNIEVIDMDIIDVSNLNRQFLFRHTDVGKAKATVAANFVNKRVPGCKIIPHVCKIQDFDSSFYRKFHIIVCGLDSIVARRWINGMLVSMLQYNDDGSLDQSSIIPLVDGGTEGFKGNARVILPGINACIECTLDLYPPQINYPMCTIAHTPRLPEHCIEYAKVLLWPQENSFGKDVAIDGDDAAHVEWLYKRALERAEEFGITGVTYRLTQGVVKHIIPAVASTNAVISAACVTEVLKIASSCCVPLNNYLVFNDADGVYTYTFEAEKDENCLSCSQKPRKMKFRESDTLNDVYEYLQNEQMLQMKAPSLTTTVDGKNKTLYMKNVPVIEKATKINLTKTLKELGLLNEQEIYVSDITTPKTLVFILQLSNG